MKRTTWVHLTLMLLVIFVLSGCSGMNTFDKAVQKIEVEDTTYTFVSFDWISKANQRTQIKEIIETALDDAEIKYNKQARLRNLYLQNELAYFLFYTRATEVDDESIEHYVRGIIDLNTLEVTIHSQHSESYIRQEEFKLIDDNHAIIRYQRRAELVRLKPYQVIAQVDTNRVLETRKDEPIVASIKDNELVVHTFSMTGVETQTYTLNTNIYFDKLYGNYLLSRFELKAYDYVLQTEVDYTATILQYPYEGLPYYNEVYNGYINIQGADIQLSIFLGQSDALKAFNQLLNKQDKMFNRYAIFEHEGDTFIALNYDNGGLLFLTDNSFNYVFKLTDNEPIYVGSHPHEIFYIFK